MLTKKILLIYLLIITFNLVESSLKFNIPSHRDKCFQQDIFIQGTLLVRYDLTGFEPFFKNQMLNELLKNIKIFIKDKNGKIVHDTELKNRKDKFAVFLKGEGIYYICTRYNKPKTGKDLPGTIMMGLKIRNDYQRQDLEQSLHKEDIKEFWKKIRFIKEELFPSLEGQKKEIEEEDKTAKSMISTIDRYYVLCLIQLVLIILITLSTLYNFRTFFKRKSII